MSFVTADLPDVTDSTRNSKLEDHTVEKLGQSSETSPCSCDMCSFTKLKEIERNIPPGLSMPYFASPFSPTNIPTGGAHLAPRTGHEQPYWHRHVTLDGST
ncbi:hypothetical protein OS493_025345 [Desmophyllum pertusum]|uniref:Uncharacterized protein n=1 Tax=Desmophyllum pertusum TaxID=174260 RepID=A0A9X0CXI6_9CNID|nr:hypothetical protein OS493_025345 [Desmophyllum pertusum]